MPSCILRDSLINIQDRRPRPSPEYSGRAIALMGVEINDHYFFHAPFSVEDRCRERRVGIDAETPTPARRRVVIAAAQIDRHSVLKSQPTRQHGSSRRQLAAVERMNAAPNRRR